MKTTFQEKATDGLHIRLRPSVKKMLLEKTKAANCSITDFITCQIKSNSRLVVGDRKDYIASLHLLSAAIHRLGININQVVHLMHQDKLTGNINDASLTRFNKLLSTYQELLCEVKTLFQEIVTYE